MGKMTQVSILSAGLVILGASLVLDALGRMTRTREVKICDGQGVNLQNDLIREKRLPFWVQSDSTAVLDIKRWSGKFEIMLRQVPVATVQEANVGWELPTLFSKTSNGDNHSEHFLVPGTYAIVLQNAHSGDSSAQVNLTLKSRVVRYPRLYEVGIQMLVVAVPLIVAGLLS